MRQLLHVSSSRIHLCHFPLSRLGIVAFTVLLDWAADADLASADRSPPHVAYELQTDFVSLPLLQGLLYLFLLEPLTSTYISVIVMPKR